jgi:hypothetical protein
MQSKPCMAAFGLFWLSSGDLDIAMDSPSCKKAMRLGPSSMHVLLCVKLGVGGGGVQASPKTSTVPKLLTPP